MRKAIQGALFIGLLAGVVFVLWQLKGGEPKEEPLEAQPVAARPKPVAARAASGGGGAAVSRTPTFTVDEDPKGTLRLEGQVLGHGDLPVGGAMVTISAIPKRTAVTEEDGSFAFDHLVGRTYTIHARAGEKAGGPLMHELTAKSEPVVIRLRQGATLTVTVLASDGGRPLAGATVKLRTREGREGTTEDKGTVTFLGVREGGKMVTASAAGYAYARRLLQVPRDATAPVAVTLKLKKGVPLSGRVLDEAGAPIAGAKVSVRGMSDLLASFSLKAVDPAESDKTGAFTISALEPGTYRVAAEHKEFAPGRSKPVEVGSNAVTDVQITLKAGAVLAGKVVTAKGAPAPWASIRVGPDKPNSLRGGRSRYRKATADKAGAFHIRGLERAKLAVAASAEGGSSEISTVDLSQKQKVEDLELRLSLEGVIAGTVVNGSGEPVPEAQVSALPDVFAKGAMKQIYMRGLGGQVSDGGGKFKFRGLPAGAYRLRASRTGVSRRMYRLQKGIEARPGDTNVQLVLEQPGGLKGQVQDQKGRAVTSFSVTVGEPPGNPVTDKEGRFQLSSIPPGKYDIIVRGSGYTPAVKKDVTVSPGQTADLGTLTMSRGRSVTGRVTDAKGLAVEGADVVLGKKIVGDGKSILADLGKAFEEASGIRKGKTDAEGNYSVSGISDGPQLIAAEHARSGRSPALAVPGGEEDARVDLQLKPLGSLQGKVTYGKKPAGGVMVVATQKGSRNQSLLVTSDDEGLYLFERLPAGSYDLMAMSKAGLGGKSGGAKTTVVEGRRATADIHVEAGEITLQVTIKGEGGAVISLAQVFLFKSGLNPKNGKEVQEVFLGQAKGGGAMMGFAKAPGSAQFKQVVPGAYSVCVLPIDGDIQDASFRSRLQKYANKLLVHCRPYTVTESPAKQTFTATVPQMTPLPE